MKSTITFIVVLLSVSLSITAQNSFPKGSLLPGGNIGFYTNNNESSAGKNKMFNLNIAPSVGIAVKENIFVGVNFGYYYSHARYTNNLSGYIDSSRQNGINYGLFGRYYKPLKHNFSIFLQADLGGKNAWGKSSSSGAAAKYNSVSWGINAGLTPGISYGISRKLQLEAGFSNIAAISYSNDETSVSGSTTGNQKQSNFGVYTNLNNYTSQLYLGFRLLLPKKTKA